jgi:uncharacterized protein with PIN domain
VLVLSLLWVESLWVFQREVAMDEDLKSCPFCGEKVHRVLEMGYDNQTSLITCEGCGAEFYSGHNSIETIDVIFNRRTQCQ